MAQGRTAAAIAERTQRYYRATLAAHGATPRGTDWNSVATQETRFAQLLRHPRFAECRSLIDLGCGYGALLGFLRRAGYTGHYLGLDVCEDMLARARALTRDAKAAFAPGSVAEPADLCVASGTFNVRQTATRRAWEGYLRAGLAGMDRMGRLGFAFNLLSAARDERGDSRYYGADPAAWFAYCRRRFSPRVALLHDYGLADFTILVSR